MEYEILLINISRDYSGYSSSFRDSIGQYLLASFIRKYDFKGFVFSGNVKDCKQRKKFINKSFELLDELDKDWRKCNYVKKLSLLPRIIKTNKKLINLYVNIVSIKYVRRKKWKQENTYHIY